MISHDDRVARARLLAANYPSAAPLLNFYVELARFQQPVFSELQSKGETDLRALLCYFPALVNLVSRSGTELLANFAAARLQSEAAQLELLAALGGRRSPGSCCSFLRARAGAALRRISRFARRHSR
jgi:hypothetical protein